MNLDSVAYEPANIFLLLLLLLLLFIVISEKNYLKCNNSEKNRNASFEFVSLIVALCKRKESLRFNLIHVYS